MTDDETLVALIDNELGESAKGEVLARLKQDETLRVRFAALRQSRAKIVTACDFLLEQTPLARLHASLPPLGSGVAGARWRPPFSWRSLAAALAVGLVLGAAGAVIGFSLSEPEEDWRSGIVEYLEFYTRDTFASFNPDPATAAVELKGVSDKVGVALTLENIAVKDLRFRVAFNLAYDGAPLAEVAYTNAKGDPAAFCVTANGEKTSLRTKTRDGVSYATWSKDGKSYILVARLPETQVEELARPLEARF
jgi:anti-sigma factor RsiW